MHAVSSAPYESSLFIQLPITAYRLDTWKQTREMIHRVCFTLLPTNFFLLFAVWFLEYFRCRNLYKSQFTWLCLCIVNRLAPWLYHQICTNTFVERSSISFFFFNSSFTLDLTVGYKQNECLNKLAGSIQFILFIQYSIWSIK